MDAMMYGAKKLFSSGKMMAAAERGLPMSRLISGKKHKITKVPGIIGGWTDYRDIPEPPKESFRNWWKRKSLAHPLATAPSAWILPLSLKRIRVRLQKPQRTHQAAAEAQAAREGKENA